MIYNEILTKHLESIRDPSSFTRELMLKIGNCFIRISSQSPIRYFDSNLEFRFEPFLVPVGEEPNINIFIEVVKALPKIKGTSKLETFHFQSKEKNWALYQNGDKFEFQSFLSGREVVAIIDKTFTDVTIFLLEKEGINVADANDIVYSFLQVLLINYYSTRNGILVHSVGIKTEDNEGLLFPGISGSGKSTTARLWHENTNATLLNDDRILVIKEEGSFKIYGTPWNGEFGDFLKSSVETSSLTKIMFIYHSKKNTLTPLSLNEAFQELYKTLFMAYFDPENLKASTTFCMEILENIPSFRYGFLKDPSSVSYIQDSIAEVKC